SKEELMDELDEQGISEKEFMSDIKSQVKIEELIEDESKKVDLEPTDDELKEAYESMKSQQDEADDDADTPDFKEVKSDMKEQMKQQKMAEEAQTLVDDLRDDDDADVSIADIG